MIKCEVAIGMVMTLTIIYGNPKLFYEEKFLILDVIYKLVVNDKDRYVKMVKINVKSYQSTLMIELKFLVRNQKKVRNL